MLNLLTRGICSANCVSGPYSEVDPRCKVSTVANARAAAQATKCCNGAFLLSAQVGFDIKTRKRLTYEQIRALLNGLVEHFGWEPIMEGPNIIGCKLDGQSVTLVSFWISNRALTRSVPSSRSRSKRPRRPANLAPTLPCSTKSPYLRL